jgi:hypothetical protein
MMAKVKLPNEINELAIQKIKEAIEIIRWQIESEQEDPIEGEGGENDVTIGILQTQIDRLKEIIKPEIEL